MPTSDEPKYLFPRAPRNPEPEFWAWVAPLIAALRVCGQDETMLLPVDEELLTRFLRDLWQMREAEWFWQRWEAAQGLLGGATKAEVARATGINEKVVKNVHDWAIGSESMGGMAEVYRRLDQQKRRGNPPTAGGADDES